MKRFPKGTRLNIDVVFPGEYRIGWRYQAALFVPGSGSYADFDTALEQAWDAFVATFPEYAVVETNQFECEHLSTVVETRRAEYCSDCGALIAQYD